MDTNRIIPDLEFPTDINLFDFRDEPLISIQDYFDNKLIYEPVYYNKKIPGTHSPVIYAREGVIKRLETALNNLPEGYTFKIFDAWRPIEVQQSLYDNYYNIISSKFPDKGYEQVCNLVKNFVSPPSYDMENPSIHNTGGAIDLTLFDTRTGLELSMGTDFDDFTEIAHTSYYEKNSDCVERNNRRILYFAMSDAGFTNLPTEWWHFDYGTKFWSFYTQKPAFYKGIRGI